MCLLKNNKLTTDKISCITCQTSTSISTMESTQPSSTLSTSPPISKSGTHSNIYPYIGFISRATVRIWSSGTNCETTPTDTEFRSGRRTDLSNWSGITSVTMTHSLTSTWPHRNRSYWIPTRMFKYSSWKTHRPHFNTKWPNSRLWTSIAKSAWSCLGQTRGMTHLRQSYSKFRMTVHIIHRPSWQILSRRLLPCMRATVTCLRAMMVVAWYKFGGDLKIVKLRKLANFNTAMLRV